MEAMNYWNGPTPPVARQRVLLDEVWALSQPEEAFLPGQIVWHRWSSMADMEYRGTPFLFFGYLPAEISAAHSLGADLTTRVAANVYDCVVGYFRGDTFCRHLFESKVLTGTKPRSIEGLDELSWVLMDFGVFVVHVFSEEARDYYELDRLWGDVPRLERIA
jgi:hypothetical protein